MVVVFEWSESRAQDSICVYMSCAYLPQQWQVVTATVAGCDCANLGRFCQGPSFLQISFPKKTRFHRFFCKTDLAILPRTVGFILLCLRVHVCICACIYPCLCLNLCLSLCPNLCLCLCPNLCLCLCPYLCPYLCFCPCMPKRNTGMQSIAIYYHHVYKYM